MVLNFLSSLLYHLDGKHKKPSETVRSNNKRHEILEAALQVVEQEGANHLTIDAVAQRSGFSKGGVLYHFASKNALLSSMMDYLLETNRGRMEEAEVAGSSVLSALVDAEQRMTEKERRASLALLAAVAENAELIVPARAHMKDIYKAVKLQNRHADDAALLMLANEGLRFLDVLGLSPMSGAELRRIRAHLKQKVEALEQ